MRRMILTAAQKLKQANGFCVSSGCGRKKASHDKLCDMHRMRMYKLRNPLAYTFNALRCNAKRRGIDFDLTFEEFRQFAKDNGYMELKGTGANDLSIDRPKNHVGYEIGNMQVLTLSENSKKYHYVDKKIEEYLARKAGIDIDSPT